MRYLAQLGLHFRGDGDEQDGNCMQLVKFKEKGHDDLELVKWLNTKFDKYTSHEIQNGRS